MATASDDVLKRVEPVLPPGGAHVIAVPMFEKDHQACGLEHTAHLPERRRHVRDCAEREGRRDAIKAVVCEWQSAAGVEVHFINWHWRSSNAPGDAVNQHPLRV